MCCSVLQCVAMCCSVLQCVDLSHSYACNLWFLRLTWHAFDITPSSAWHDTSHASRLQNANWMRRLLHQLLTRVFLCMTQPIPMCDVTHFYMWYASFLCVVWHIPMCHTFLFLTHSYVWHASLLCVTWLVPHNQTSECLYLRNGSFINISQTCFYLWHDSFHVWHDSFRCATRVIPTCDINQSFYV